MKRWNSSVNPKVKKKSGGDRRRRDSALTEGLAVGALIHSRILLVGTHQNAVQRAVVCGVAMVCAGLDGAFDALVCVFVHGSYLLFWILL